MWLVRLVSLMLVAGAAPVRADAPAPTTTANLVQDPQFDAGESGFVAQDASSLVVRSADAPLEGAHSLRVSIAGYGNHVWWSHGFAGGRVSAFRVSAHLRADVASSSELLLCAMAYYADGEAISQCTTVDAALGDKGTVASTLSVDPTRPLASVNIRLDQQGAEPVSFTLDAASAVLDVVALPPDGGGGGAGGGSGGAGGGSSGPTCAPTRPDSVYPGFTYALPTQRPFIALGAYLQGGPHSTPAQRLIAGADALLADDAPYGYSAKHMVLAYRLTGEARYLASAIAQVERFVTAAESASANGDAPAIAGDSYLDVGAYIEDLALTYDNALGQLTPQQRQRWAAFAEQAVFNIWHPAEATWGGHAQPWTGWAVCDPGNNYHFSFLRATMLWALASQNPTWFEFLQTQKLGPLLDYYAALPGGGTREGTGYGSALDNLFGDYLYWKASTGEDLANVTAHTRETIDYWIHATVPTLDRFAPIADLSRSSLPELYDYQENLVHQAVVLSAGSPQARRGLWWLQNNSVRGVAHAFNLQGDLLPYPDAPEAPTALSYHSPGAAAFFARTSWDPDASWMAFVAGQYDQSHAHQEQGAFTFFKHDWLTVTSNIWSHSGIHQEVDVNNVLRFERADGTIVPQNQSDTLASSLTPTHAQGVTTVSADLTNAYSASRAEVHAWTRTLVLAGNVLRVSDVCSVANGVRAVFQLHVPTAPALQADGSIVAGNLRIVLLQPATASFTAMDPTEFQRGYRVDLIAAAGCAFDLELHALPAPASTPTSSLPPTPGATSGSSQSPTPNPSPASPSTSVPLPTGCAGCPPDPVEPIWSEFSTATRIKSPAQHMHFTAGAPLRILADALDANAWMCPPGHPPYVCPGTEVRFYVDGQLVASVPPSVNDFNLWEARLPGGLPAGAHVLTVKYVPYNPATGGGAAPIDGLVAVTIDVDPAPVHARTITLTQDLVLTGANALDWSDATVIGNGFRVTSAAGYSGTVRIENALVRGLGSFTAPGLDVITTGSVSVRASIFEATGALRLGGAGSASLTVSHNEFRANNLLTYVASNPDVPVALELVGGTTGAKTVQGNRIGAGILRINGGDAWQIGGLAAGEGNVLMGPRAVLHVVNSSNDRIQGNYLHHDYHGGFSQGFNLWLEGSSDHELVEHNVIRGGSWPIQSLGGEFRYNLVVDSGHDFWRSAANDTQIHHNVFAHANGPNTGYDGALRTLGAETGIDVYNNTFDVGGASAGFDAPAFTIGSTSRLGSIRNNLFVNFSEVQSGFGRAFVSTSDGTTSSPRVTTADYNAWHNPLAPNSLHYLAGLIQNAPGSHDVLGNPRLSGSSEIPYQVSQSCLWLGTCATRDVLAHYREVYRPAANSPLIGAGDPADGVGTAIGAVGPDDSNPVDLFGRVGSAPTPEPDTVPPVLSTPSVVSLTSHSVVIAWTTNELADSAIDYGLDTTYGQSASSAVPTLDHSLAIDGLQAATLHHYRMRSVDAAGNTATSADFTFTTAATPSDTTPPTVAVSAPIAGSSVTGTLSLVANAADNVGVAGVRLFVDGTQVGAERTTPPYSVAWDTTTVPNGSHVITASARDAAGNSATSATVSVTVSNGGPAPSGPIAAYAFSEGQGTVAADASGHGLAGTVSNATWTPGPFGSALQFTGASNSRVTVASTPLLQLATFTLSAWVNPSAAQPSEPTVIAKEISGDLPYVLYARGSGSGPNAYVLAGGSYQNAAATSTLPANTWTHLATTYDGTTLRLYVNGVLAGSTVVSGSLASGNGALRIGNNAVFGNEGFVGRIDEVRIYARALAPAELQADMQTPIEAVPAPTDTTPPTGAIQVNAGAASTNQVAVTLSLSALDDATGVAQMRFSNDGINFLAPVPFASTAPWTLAAGPGVKTVHAQFRDGAGNWSNAFTDSIVLAASAPGDAQLGAHVLYAQNDTFGTSPAVTPPIVTQPSGSTLLALSMGWLRNLAAPVDSFGNAWLPISGPNIYFSADFYTALWAAPVANGGAGHTLSFDKSTHPQGEISMALIEVTHGGAVDMVYDLAPGSNQTPGSLTVTGPATLIAIWGGDSAALDHTAVPDNGFTVIDSYLDFGSNGETAVQVAIAAKQVTTPGTYTVRWTSTPTQNCACYLIAVHNPQQTPPGLVAAYGFDEGQGTTTADASGHGLAGTLSNTSWTTGKFGSALQFAGDGAVSVASTPLLQFTTAFTVSAWVNPQTPQPPEATLIAKQVPGDLSYVLYANGSGVGPNAFTLIGGNYRQAAAASPLPVGTWSHVAATYDGALLSVYVNGVLASSSAVTGSLTSGSGPLQIGNNSVFPNEGFVGRIDEVRVYERALSASELQADMAVPVAAP
jgi:hypothetical protein